jgi:hypothetical protein
LPAPTDNFPSGIGWLLVLLAESIGQPLEEFARWFCLINIQRGILLKNPQTKKNKAKEQLIVLKSIKGYYLLLRYKVIFPVAHLNLGRQSLEMFYFSGQIISKTARAT